MTRKPPTRILAATAAIMLASSLLARPQDRPADPERQLPPPEIFSPPSREELANLTHPALRIELLRMAADDQHARLSGS